MAELKVYTLTETAAILKVNKRFLYPYLEAGALKGAKIGRAWRITEDAIRDFLSTGAPILDENRNKARAKMDAANAEQVIL